ncbi:MAG: IS110 family transposase [Epsilonproteobacteria bacterium]|nr:IS110 family transposase [Campylobacterota bacterium]
MFYVGIDIAKKFNVACIIDDKDNIIKKSFKFNNDEKGFNDFNTLLSSIKSDVSNFIIGMEATGLLFENLYLYLKDKGYNIILLNPYQTSKFREMNTMKKVKNDNIDAFMIASLIKSGRFSKAYVSEDVYASLRALHRHRASLKDELKKHKRQLSSLLSVVFPEMEQIIKDPFSVTALTLLEKYPTPKHYKYASPQRILKLFRNIKGNNFNLEKANKLLELAKSSIYSGNAYDERAYVIQSHIRAIRFLESEIALVENKMLELFNQFPTLTKEEEKEITDIIDNLRTIPGVSDKTLFTIMGECGNLDRFKNIDSFIGYLGLYPTLEQSGSITKYGKLAKRGSKLAKSALYKAAVAAIRHNDEMKKLYCDKVSQGRAKKEALIIVARKLAAIILAIYKHNTPYNPNRVFNQNVT